MKKIALSLIALATLSTASFAERSADLRDLDTYTGQYANPSVKRLGTAGDEKALKSIDRVPATGASDSAPQDSEGTLSN